MPAPEHVPTEPPEVSEATRKLALALPGTTYFVVLHMPAVTFTRLAYADPDDRFGAVPPEWHPVQWFVKMGWICDAKLTGAVHDCESTGAPPVQPAGEEETTVRVCVPDDEHADHVEYVNVVHVGAAYVHDCESTGVPPVHPAGDDETTVRVCVPDEEHADHTE